MTTYDAYVICTAPRSGSTMLCSLLAATGVAGKPASYFHEPSVAEWLEDLGLSADPAAEARAQVATAFEAALRAGRGGGAMFGLRLQGHSLGFFRSQLAVLHPEAATDVARLRRAFGVIRFIYLRRADKLDQAVSYLKAEQTGLWHVAPDGSELERLAPHREPAYDREKIAGTVATMEGYDRAWEDWFANEGIAPLRIAYDELSADPSDVLRRVLADLGLDPAAAEGVSPGVRKLSDGTNRDWAERYRAGR